MTSYTVAFLSPEPVTMNWSSGEMSQLRTDEDSFDWRQKMPFVELVSKLYSLNTFKTTNVGQVDHNEDTEGIFITSIYQRNITQNPYDLIHTPEIFQNTEFRAARLIQFFFFFLYVCDFWLPRLINQLSFYCT